MTRDEAEGKFYQLAALSFRTKLLENEIRKALGKNGNSSFLHTVFQDIRANGSDNLDNLLKLMELKRYFPNNSKTSPLIKSALFGEITPGTVVHCKTEKEARELLSFAEELGYLWLDHGQPLQSIKFGFHEDQTCYKFGDELDVYGKEGKFISFGPLAAFKSKETPVLSYNEFFASLQKQIFESLDEEREV